MVIQPPPLAGGVKVVSASSREGGDAHVEQTAKLTPFLDPHMLFHILNWLREKQLYPNEEIDEARIAVLTPTNLLAGISEVCKMSGKSPPFDVESKRQAAIVKHELYDPLVRPFVECIQEMYHLEHPSRSMRESSEWWATTQRASVEASLKEANTPPEEIVKALSLHLPFPEDSAHNVLMMSKSFYESGEYENAFKWLKWCEDRVCETTTDGLNFELRKIMHWGKLSSLVMINQVMNPTAVYDDDIDEQKKKEREKEESNWAMASEQVLKIDELLDDASKILITVKDPSENKSDKDLATAEGTVVRQYSYEQVLLQRTWLLHWALWPIFRYYLPRTTSGQGALPRVSSFPDLANWFLAERTMSLVKLTCPHLIRYYGVWAILNRKTLPNKQFETIIEIFSTSSTGTKDPFSSLLMAGLVLFDYDEAKQKLAECSDAAEADFFLAPLKGVIEEQARLLIFETYCRIHKSINIDMIATQLNMSSETAERWIVNLIRHAKFEAKIDSERNRVEISNQSKDVYHQVKEKCEEVMIRSKGLVDALERQGRDRGRFGDRDNRDNN
eukprot:GHVN01008593.1.p1 GENE.GHVN01008593.1~~GHVN01008593.1.p1  ORF type:complete len:559 (+),score=103.40 GHVN01008593.1:121-1797(+)